MDFFYIVALITLFVLVIRSSKARKKARDTDSEQIHQLVSRVYVLEQAIEKLQKPAQASPASQESAKPAKQLAPESQPQPSPTQVQPPSPITPPKINIPVTTPANPAANQTADPAN